MSIGKNSIVLGNFPDDVPDNTVVLNLSLFNCLDQRASVLHPTEDNVVVGVFKVPASIRAALRKSCPQARIDAKLSLLINVRSQVDALINKCRYSDTGVDIQGLRR